MGYYKVRYDSRVVNYARRGFIRLATGKIATVPWLCKVVCTSFFPKQFVPRIAGITWYYFTVSFCKKSFTVLSQQIGSTTFATAAAAAAVSSMCNAVDSSATLAWYVPRSFLQTLTTAYSGPILESCYREYSYKARAVYFDSAVTIVQVQCIGINWKFSNYSQHSKLVAGRSRIVVVWMGVKICEGTSSYPT